jgi:class 3 adenylate cyclase
VGLAAGGVVAMSGDYYGEVVNLAARLLALAEPSTVVVDEAVRGRVAEGFAFAPVAPTAVKGFDVAPQAYRVTR